MRLHAARAYTAFMLGFTPGFAYLGLLPQALEAPRHATPRLRVPGGSVALAGGLTGIYPAASPGGWQLVGRCAQRLFDPFRAEPALVAPGDRVRFLPVAELADEPLPHAAPRPALDTAALEVLEPGLLTSVQDAGRPGWRRLGVGGAGAADARALVRANEALGNAPGAAALECTLAGPALLFHRPVRFALAGADLGAQLLRSDLGAWPCRPAPRCSRVPATCCASPAAGAGLPRDRRVEGGLDVPEVLGSRSTDLGSAFGGWHGQRSSRRSTGARLLARCRALRAGRRDGGSALERARRARAAGGADGAGTVAVVPVGDVACRRELDGVGCRRGSQAPASRRDRDRVRRHAAWLVQVRRTAGRS